MADFNDPPPAHCFDGPFAPLSRVEMDEMAKERSQIVTRMPGPGTFFLGGKL